MRFTGGVQRTGPLQTGLSQLEWLSYRSGARGLFPNLFQVIAVPAGLSDREVGGVIGVLLRRHEVLRTSFDADGDGRPRQCVHQNVLAVLPRVEGEDSRRRFIEAPFDVASGPPVRFGRISEGDLIVVVAHLAADATGFGILVSDLTELLAAQEQQRVARLGAEVPQPIDRAVYEAGRGRSRVESALRHWNTTLRDFPVTVLPVSRGQPGTDVVCSDLESPAAGLALASLQRTFSASPAAVFIAAAYTALAIQFKRDRLRLNLTWSFRELPATREMVASVFRDMPLMIDLQGKPSFSEVLRQVQRAILVGGRQMSFDVMEFYECAGRIETERGSFLFGPESINCTFDGIEPEPAEPGDDLLAVLADSRVSIDRINGFSDLCNLYIGVYPAEGRLHLYSAIDAAVPGGRYDAGLVKLIEAILVHAATSGDLTFPAAEALAIDPWRPGGRWARIDGVWVDLDFLTDRLLEHPAVHHADVREESDRVTAYVSADLQPWELRDFLLSTDNGRNAMVSPPHFVVRRSDAVTVAGPGADRPMLVPEGAAEQALRNAVAKANDLADLTMAGTYLDLLTCPWVVRRVVDGARRCPA
jgi:hypothetical protein